MNWNQFLTSSVGRKFVMAVTGLFLIFFLIVHAYVNVNVLFENGAENFNRAANFMSTNVLVRIMEFGLFAGFIVHIYQGYLLARMNNARRTQKYAINAPAKTSTWYSRSMALLGTLILLFLVIHLKDFWAASRFGGLNEVEYTNLKTHDLYAKMDSKIKRCPVCETMKGNTAVDGGLVGSLPIPSVVTSVVHMDFF